MYKHKKLAKRRITNNDDLYYKTIRIKNQKPISSPIYT